MRKILLLVFGISLFGCQKTLEIAPNIPGDVSIHLKKIEVHNVKDIAVEAELKSTSEKQTVDYGFIISESNEPTLERGRVIEVGSTNTSITFNYMFTELDSGKTYNIRAYVQLADTVAYSAIRPTSTVAPSILSLSTDTISYSTFITIRTNIKNLEENTPVSILIGNIDLKLIASYDNGNGREFIVELPRGLQAGNYEVSLKMNNTVLTYRNKVTVRSGEWEKVTDLPPNNWDNTVTFVKDNWIYILQYTNIYGQTATIKATFFKQHLLTGQIISLTPYHPNWLLRFPSIVIDESEVHFIGGEEVTDVYLNTMGHYIYNIINDSWSKEADFPGDHRIKAISGIYGNKIYFGLGYYLPSSFIGGDRKLKNDLWEYDIKTKNWKQLSNFPQFGRVGSASFQIGAQLFVVGGNERRRSNKETWCYDISTNEWSRKSNFPGEGLVGLSGFSIGDYGYAGLGENGTFDSFYNRPIFSTFFRFNPKADKWNRVQDFIGNTPLDPYTATNGDMGILIGTDGPYERDKISVFTYKP